MPLGSGHVVTILSAVHPEAKPGIVEARLKYLQRLPFPRAGMDVGRGWRVEYNADDVMRLVSVFELLAAAVAPQQAAQLVSRQWDVVAAGMAEAWTMIRQQSLSLVMLARLDGFDPGAGAGSVATGPDEMIQAWRKQRETDDRRAVVVDLLATMRLINGTVRDHRDERIRAFHAELSEWVSGRNQLIGMTAKTGT